MKKLMLMAVMMTAAFAATADDFGFTYQAELKDAKGNNLSSRNQTVEIRLWKTANTSESGDLLWGRTYNIYTDTNGLFNQEVSDSTGSLVADWPSGKTVLPLSAVICGNEAGMVYLGLKVKDSAGEIVPRQRLFAVPFAGRANSANNLVGNTHSVEGTLKLGSTGSLSPSGLTLPTDSSSTMGDVKAASITCTGGDLSAANVNFTGKLTYDSGKEIIPVPIGGVIMWTKDTLPDNEHWAICDGSTKNGVQTPDLRGRFIVGVGSCTDSEGNTASYKVKESGGVNKHKLTVDEMPGHSHTVATSTLVRRDLTSGSDYTYLMNGSGNNITSSTVGNGQTHENRPPYYALYYIMRIK